MEWKKKIEQEKGNYEQQMKIRKEKCKMLHNK